MMHRGFHAVLLIVLLNVAVGCAGPTSESGITTSASPQSPSAAAGVSGTWRGYFAHPGADYTSAPGSTELTLQVREDSTYSFKWGSRPERTGTIAANGNRIILNDSSGSQITLVYSDGMLYGGIKDFAPPGRVVTMSLKRDETAEQRAAASAERPAMRSRVCNAAGGTYSNGACEPN